MVIMVSQSWKLQILVCRDTGYNEIQFKEIGDEYGPFDLSAIPIGAYEPRWFMKSFPCKSRGGDIHSRRY